jgi:hypothetical protein
VWGTFGGTAFTGFLAPLFERENRRHHRSGALFDRLYEHSTVPVCTNILTLESA